MSQTLNGHHPRSSRGEAPADDKVNILVVDDLPEKHQVYHAMLEDLRQNLVFASSGEKALKLLLKHEFAVILLDVNMPGIDGLETATLIRKRRKSAHTPIIFLTAFSDEVLAAQGYASGAVDYLLTPIVPEVLRAKVSVFIELSRMRRQAAMQAEERARREAAEEADRRKDEFLGMLAHELRNPLGPIHNAVHLMQMIGLADPRLEQMRDIIDRQVKHMARLIDDLLDATRIAHGKILLRKDPCDLARITHQTVEDHRNIFDASGLRIETRIPDAPMIVEGDPTRLTQIIGNLLHNAHKFTNPGGEITVSLSAMKKGYATLTVRDTGVGIDANMLPCIFDVFRQAEQGLDRRRGGLGLGLALVKGLVALHDGSVGVTSEGLGKGSVFTLHLPLAQAAALPSDRNSALLAPAAETKYRVLIIEDNPDTAESTRMLLAHDGYDVRIACSGHAGLEMARAFLPRIILCDIGLPGMDGYQLVRRIREDTLLSAAYVIALTGYGRDEDQRQSHEAGFDLHLTKPIDHNNLRRALMRLHKNAA